MGSRASDKLLQLNSMFGFLQTPQTVLDLCAAPGGWMQVALDRAPVGSFILGIDLIPISPIPGCVTIQQDITRTNECKSKIKQVMEMHGLVNETFDLVMHDGSLDLGGGARDQEAMSRNALAIEALKLATEFLSPRGNFITKVFRSRDYNVVFFCLSKLFDKVVANRPKASRSQPAEIYLLGLRYKAPAKIDPRLFDYRHLFKVTAEEPTRKVMDVLGGSKQKRQRNGESILRNVATAADYIWCENPLEILGSVTCLSFDDQASLPLKQHDLTTDEVKILCDDLLDLGRKDLKNILKWRMQIRKALTLEEKKVTKKGNEDEDEDDELIKQLEELTITLDRKKRAKGKKDLMAIDNEEDDNDNENKEGCDDDGSSYEELQRYNKQMEEMFDEVYELYMMKKQRSSAKPMKQARHLIA